MNTGAEANVHVAAKSGAVPSAGALPAWVVLAEARIRAVDSTAFPVAQRVIRRVLRAEVNSTNPWSALPHRKLCAVDRERLSWLVAPDELGLDSPAGIPARSILIERPSSSEFSRFDGDSLLRYYWRMLFHARLDEAWLERQAASRLTIADVRRRIAKFGQEQFDEVRAVLQRDGMLRRHDDIVEAYGEFISTFFELKYFDPELVAFHYPSIEDHEKVAERLAADVDPRGIFERTRPAGMDAVSGERASDQSGVIRVSLLPAPQERNPSRAVRYLQRAAKPLTQGNHVRGALLQQQAVNAGSEAAVDALDETLTALAERLSRALDGSIPSHRWVAVWKDLLPYAVAGFWNAETRLLYDLQKACIDREREVYRVNAWTWIVSGFRKPLKQPLHDQPLVLANRHVRSALARIPALNVPSRLRNELSSLLHEASSRSEQLLRAAHRPVLLEALPSEGLAPQSQVERFALENLVDELLDSTVSRGFVGMSDVRDAIARSPLKLSDLSNPAELIGGDLLLRIDRRLTDALPGAYRPGPFYLTWMQRFNSVVFATPLGRFLTKYLALPFGGAFIILEGLQHLVDPLVEFFGGHAPHILTRDTWIGFGCFLFALIHSEAVRQVVWQLSLATWRLVQMPLYDFPRAVLTLNVVQALLRSLPALLFRRFLLAPLIVTGLAAWLLPRSGLVASLDHWKLAVVFLATCIALNSRAGRDTEELASEWVESTWHQLQARVIMAMFAWIVDMFRQVVDFVERILYSVDELLRFRSGESGGSLAIKAVLGAVWGVATWIVRFCVTLLIEPQINPIKHFPVVTVSHKLIFPLFLANHALLAPLVGTRLDTRFVASAIATVIPGIFGFFAWELKENWKLYRANRAKSLQPAQIGRHGESMARLLTPGFHSGAIPKLFERRRRAVRGRDGSRRNRRLSRYDEELHHIEETLHRFLERGFLRWISESPAGASFQLSAGPARIGVNRVELNLSAEGWTGAPLAIVFSEQSSFLVASFHAAEWVATLDAAQRSTLHTALAGFYKYAGVELVREQIEARLGSRLAAYDVADVGLVVWPTNQFDVEVVLDLDERPVVTPRPRSAAREHGINIFTREELLFSELELTLNDWTRYWDLQFGGDTKLSPVLAATPVLPSPPSPHDATPSPSRG